MPSVPRYGGERVGLSDAPTPQQTIATPAGAFGAGAAEGLGQVGSALANSGEAITARAVKIKAQDNQAEADNLITKYILGEKDLLYTGDDAYYNKQGMNAYTGYKPAQEGVTRLRDDIGSEATNPAVRNLVDTATRRQMSFSLGNMASHASSERRKGLVNTANSAIDASIDQASLYYNNDEAFNKATADIVDQNFQKGGILGWTPDEFDNANHEAIDKAWNARIRRTANADPHAALDMFNANTDKLSRESQIALGPALKALVLPTDVETASKNISKGGPVAAPSNVYDIIVGKGEASPTTNGVGQVSPKGARGVGQVMPDTAARVAQSLGIPFDAKNPADLDRLKNDDAFSYKIGQTYFNDQMRRFGGDPLKAAAAYNAGPGWVAAAEKKASDMAAAGTIGPQADWRWQLAHDGRAEKYHQETDKYIGRVNDALASQGSPGAHDPNGVAQSLQIAQTLDGRLDQAAKLAEAEHPGEPQFAKMLERQVKSDWVEEKQAATIEEASATDRLMTTVSGGVNADGPKPKSVAELLRDPQSQQDWLAIPQVKRNALINEIEQNAKPAKQASLKTPQAAKAYNAFRAEAQLSPDTFTDRDFTGDALYAKMPQDYKNKLIGMQLKIQGGRENVSNVSLNRTFSLKPVQEALTAAGMKKGDDDYNAFSGGMLEAIETFTDVASSGRKPNDKELTHMATDLLSRDDYSKGAHLIVGGVPPDDAKEIVQQYRQRFGGTPTMTQISQFYSTMQARKKAKPNG